MHQRLSTVRTNAGVSLLRSPFPSPSTNLQAIAPRNLSELLTRTDPWTNLTFPSHR
ncbi:MAG: hypothetical protein HC769_37950 [Cyanobacteria bacterium CRU_2_1]|nr:hypothetical protein [Cyanobacteria bacterium CRU_2_1]